jgi:hypothetical protein
MSNARWAQSLKRKMSLDNQRIREIKNRLQPLLEAEARALELKECVPDAACFVGLAGVKFLGEPHDVVAGLVSLRRITNAPGIVHVCRAADPKRSDYLGVARYSHTIKAEIAVGRSEAQDNPEFVHNLAWHTAALLKLRGHQTLFCPGSSTVSWDTVASVLDQSTPFLVLDDVPQQIRIGQLTEISHQDLEWVRDNWQRALNLRDASSSRRFGLAFNVSYTWNHTKDIRLAIANIWSGLEALFGIQTDRPVTQRLVERITAWLPGISEDDVRALYNHRCDAVHGRWMRDEELADVIKQSAQLLQQALVRCVEREEKTLPDW